MAARKLASLSDDALLSGTTDERINRMLLLLRDGFKELHERVDEHINKTEERFIAVESEMKQKYEMLAKRMHQLETKQDNEQVLSEYHTKKYNMVINNMPEESGTWESNTDSIDKVHDFFRDILGVENADNMRFVNAHRMGLRKTIEDPGTGAKLLTRPIIVRFGCMPDKEKVQKKLTALRNYNRDIPYHKHRVFVTDQLPRRMDEQRKLLVQQFRNARKNKIKAKWSVDKHGNYCLYINNEQVFP